MSESEIKVKSLQKALRVLECFVQKQPLGVTEISEKMGFYKSNVHNILSTYKAMGYLEQDADSGKFYLGPAIFDLNRALRQSLNITGIAMPYMRRIAKETNELVYLTIPKGQDVIYIETVMPDSKLLGSPTSSGERIKMYCTAVGKAMLSHMSPEEVEACLPDKLEAFTEYTIVDKSVLYKELYATRQRGYGIDDMELVFGMKCVGVAILDHRGQVVAGLSVSAPSPRMTTDKIQQTADILKASALELGQKL